MKFGSLLAGLVVLSCLCLTASPLIAQDEPPAPAAGAEEQGPAEEPAPPPSPVHRHPGEFSYTVRPGDSLGSIASTFGIQVSDIARANRISQDAMLMVGQTLRIPNPFAARMRELTAENQKLSDELTLARSRADQADASASTLKAQVQQLTAGNQEQARELRMLPWWRGAVYSAAIVALLMLGVTALAILEWFLLRRRYVAVAEMNESLRRLDQRYKVLFAKAELRMQELYGRRRRGMADDQERPKLPEEAELELLDQQLRDVLEHHLEQLGGRARARRRGRWREDFGAVAPPVEARSARR
ncbi:MAG TPA: LysM peptidoglycan-binding domain-containing protein [Candidatus Binataceae bacterium]|nr:LysM peptidoglycan-binding domain-containing protein [Candidatus Binataceae bacterium]